MAPSHHSSPGYISHAFRICINSRGQWLIVFQWSTQSFRHLGGRWRNWAMVKYTTLLYRPRIWDEVEEMKMELGKGEIWYDLFLSSGKKLALVQEHGLKNNERHENTHGIHSSWSTVQLPHVCQVAATGCLRTASLARLLVSTKVILARHHPPLSCLFLPRDAPQSVSNINVGNMENICVIFM